MKPIDENEDMRRLQSKLLVQVEAARPLREFARFKLLGQFHVSAPEVCRLARGGDSNALALAWGAATELAQTILAIAETEPQRLNPLAPYATYMPSLLSCSKSFNKVTAKLAEKVGLSSRRAVSHRPRLRLDSLTTRFVVELFEQFDSTRRGVQRYARAYRRQLQLRKKYRTLNRYLFENWCFCPEDLRLLKIDPLNGETVTDWWETVFKPHLEDEFTMHTLRGTPLYTELCRCNKARKPSRILMGFVGDKKRHETVSEVKDYLVKDELKRRCQDALERLAKSFDSSKPTPKNR